ncbi:YggL family protein [Burkholderia multivorans]|uniref:YggL 50S ribosome-binding family protein n=1 Tax=Burkholderia multivorans TaxID=87883 RepID=UPI0015913449|nr:YggL family protein [Burkholderia multivorans]
MSQRHNRRQRKKLHIGEFQELAFNATAQYRRELSDLERGQLIDAFIDFVEANGLLTVASADDGIGAYVISGAPRGTTTEADREAVRAWLAARPELADVEVSEFTDAWYPLA